MICKKWWLWTVAVIVAAAVAYAVFFYAGNKEQSPGATLVRVEEGEIGLKIFYICRRIII